MPESIEPREAMIARITRSAGFELGAQHTGGREAIYDRAANTVRIIWRRGFRPGEDGPVILDEGTYPLAPGFDWDT